MLDFVAKAIVAPLAAFVMLATVGAATGAPPPPNVLQFDLSVDIDYVDPALAYYVPTWQIEYATCSRLVNYADAPAPEGNVIRPEIAAALPAVSADGRTYTFTVREDFFFSPPSNERVTPAHFKYAIDRTLTRSMNSPAQPFLNDIVGADEVINGTATTVSGVVASNNTLSIQLEQPAADFLARVAMPFFCPLPTSVPVDPDGIDAPVPSAGPYYIDQWSRQQEIVLKENPNYAGPRPHHFDAIHYTIGHPLETIKLRIETGESDLGDIPPASHAELGPRYGPGSPAAFAGRQQYFFFPAPTILYLAMNHDRPLFGSGGPRGNVGLKKAVNFAIDRTAMAEQRGAYAGSPTDQHLPHGMPGFRDVNLYPVRPDLAKARELAGCAPDCPTRQGILYCSNRAPAPATCQIVQSNLRQIGLQMEIKLFPRATQFELAGRRGEPFDMTLEGWHMDRFDPFDFLRLLDGTTLRPANNVNFAYFDNPEYNRRISEANLLHGVARDDAFGALDVEIARDAAPWAAYAVPNDRLFFSERIGCQAYVPAFGISLGALCVRPAISTQGVNLAEGDSGEKAAVFTVSLDGAAPADYPVTVSYATADGTARASDYRPSTGTLTFAIGERSKTIAVDVFGDTTAEPTEIFHLLLSSPTKGTVVRGRAEARIVNDDGGDTTPPVNPTTVASPSHFLGEWSIDPEVEVQWSGASDDSEVAGYSVEWSDEPGTVPDGSVDLTETEVLDELDDGEWWFHVRAIDTSGNPADGAAHLGPFSIDTTDPDDPTPSSSSHTVGAPSRDNTVDIAWSGASDGDGSGIAGYSVEWTRAAGTQPDEDIETAGESATSPALADGGWWFHLRTADEAGNWTNTVHLGPFVVDATAPSNPTLSSPSHAAGIWSSGTSVSVRWAGADDAVSGVNGYSFELGPDPSTLPDAIKDADEHVNGYVTGPLTASTVYFHLRVVDNAGNWSSAVHIGPFLLDPDAPVNPALRGLSHRPGTPSTVKRVRVAWAVASDERSGVDGFSFEWSQTADTTPDATKDAEEGTSEMQSAVLAIGRWWFHLRTRDNAGNWSTAVHLGPFVIRGPVARPKPKAKPKKVTLCHRGRTIKVPKSAVKKHRKHGDKLGACKKKKRPKR